MSKPRPTGVTADRNERIVTITWDDGHVSRYSFAGLRAVCPCVNCRGGHEFMGEPPDPWIAKEAQDDELTLYQVEQVGSYALQFSWSDDHSSGIYTWDYLRQACPCDLCLP